MKSMKIGIMPMEQYKKRTIAIAKGEYIPKKDDPKIWFPSVESALQVLSSKNQELLKVIKEKKPQSLGDLESLTGRKRPNLSRTLKTMEAFGLVKITKEKQRVIPEVVADSFNIDIALEDNYLVKQ